MTALEKKALAFEKLAAVNNEAAIDEILAYLEKVNNEAKPGVYNLSKHTEAISKTYDETLEKLAQ